MCSAARASTGDASRRRCSCCRPTWRSPRDTSAKLGIDTQFNGADWPMIRDRIFGRIDPISAGGREYRATGTPNVTLIEGTARFIGDKTFVDRRR